MRCALFPHLHEESVVRPPPAKRRKTSQDDADSEDVRGVVLESLRDTYLVTWCLGKAEYTLSVIEPRQRRVGVPPPEATLKTQGTCGQEERGVDARDPPECDEPMSSKHRVLRANISSDDFSFENDLITIRAPHADDKKMDVDNAVKMWVLRWRWYSQ